MTIKKKKPCSNGSKTSPETGKCRVRAAKALELRMEGLTFEVIAKTVGYNSKQAAHDAVKRALDAITREPAQDLIKLDLERLDVLWQIQYLNAQGGDVQAMAACMKIMERRAKLLGLDAPAKQEHTGKDGSSLIGGAFILPGVLTPEEWEAAASEQQEELTRSK